MKGVTVTFKACQLSRCSTAGGLFPGYPKQVPLRLALVEYENMAIVLWVKTKSFYLFISKGANYTNS